MAQKLLPLAEPRILGYLHHSYVLSIVGHCPRFEDWYYSSYVQLYDDYLTGGLNFYEHDFTRIRQPLLDHHSMCIDAFKTGGYEIVEFAKHCLNTDYYFYTFIEEGDIPGKPAFSAKISHPHEMMIFGYDDERTVFHTIGFNDKFQYEKQTVSYAHYAKSFKNLRMTADYMNNIHLLKPDLNAEYPFNLKQVTSLLDDYCHSRNTSEQYSMVRKPYHSAFGLAVYDYLIEVFDKVARGKSQPQINSLQILWEHKRVMLERVAYLQRKHGLLLDFDSQRLKEIERLAYKTRDELIVFSISKDKKCFQKIIANLGMMREMEKDALALLLEELWLITDKVEA